MKVGSMTKPTFEGLMTSVFSERRRFRKRLVLGVTTYGFLSRSIRVGALVSDGATSTRVDDSNLASNASYESIGISSASNLFFFLLIKL